ncbi:MAG: aspartate aminotransferase family protein [Myxococcales bacterium]|nr:aspartate aminotransferase family protein [Myxococcales bacterium]
MHIPAKGTKKEAILSALEERKRGDYPWRSGRGFAYQYDAGKEAEEVAKSAFTMFLSENALDPTAYPSLLRFENEIIAMAAAHLGGGEGTVGAFTSGGTESILLAVKAARDFARQHRPEITQPEMVLPITAHAAFLKAAEYFGVRPIVTKVTPGMRADVAAMRAAVNDNTILLVGSASSYAHGTVDPITEIAAIGKEKDIPVHVDGCIGGFLLPYFRRLGEAVPAFGFDVPGVTSISMDLHKYAYAAKGASVVLYRDRKLRDAQIFSYADWPGYTMVNTTVQSTKSGGPLAAAWAVLTYFGDDGYLAVAEKLLDSKRKILAGIREIPGLFVIGEPEMCLIAFGSETVDVFHLADELREVGWMVQPQLSHPAAPANLHLTLMPSNAAHTDEFLRDLAAAMNKLRAKGKIERDPAVDAIAAQLSSPDVEEKLPMLAQMLGIGGDDGPLPKRMADVNSLLDAMPPPARERLIRAFVSQMFTPAHGS